MIAQVQCERKLLAHGRSFDVYLSGGVSEAREARETPTLGLERVHRKGLVAAPARMHHVVAAAAFRSTHPGVHYIERQRRVNTDARMQGRPRLPRTIAHPGD